MLTSYVHPRLGLPSFKKFEPFFLEALRAWPKETQFTIFGGLSPNTITARMRDSLQGYRLNCSSWQPSIDPEFAQLFAQYDGKFMVSMAKDGTVWLRHRIKQGSHLGNGGPQFHEVEGDLSKHIRSKSFVSAQHQPTPAAAGVTIKTDHLTELDYNNLTVLLAHEAFEAPLIFTGDVTSRFADSFQLHGVTAHYNPERNETIVI